jgi:osmotically-inducible protein OsmY
MSFLIGATTITMIMLFAVGVGSSEAQTPSPPDRVVDAKLTVKITTALLADQRFSGKQISVVTIGAATTLRGKVDSEETRGAAADIARRVEGVGEVRNELQVVPPLERAKVDANDLAISRAIEQQFKRDPQLQVVVIDTHVDAGIVTLSGQVPSPEIVARAADLASSAPGVRSVKNELSSTARTKPE